MRRGDFLRTGAGALAVAYLPPLTRRARSSDVVNVTITSQHLTGGGIAYNGSIPGPFLRVAYGQRICANYLSRVWVPTSIHWHGMLLPNAMDGVAGVTQPPVPFEGSFVYDFLPGPPGTRWYHDHAFSLASARGLFGMFVVEDPGEEAADREFALVFHDVPRWSSVEAAERGLSSAPMTGPQQSARSMPSMSGPMGDEVAYVAHRINGASYPGGKRLAVRIGDRVRLRLLNASPTQTRYVRLAGHALLVTHADGNRLARSIGVDVLRIATGERYDAYVEVRKPGAFLLQGISTDPLESEQAAVIYTPGMKEAPPLREPISLEGLRVFGYELAGEVATRAPPPPQVSYELVLGGGGWGDPRWTINGETWPKTPKLEVRRGDVVDVRFRNTSAMEHPMHLHGHTFSLTEVNGAQLLRPLSKDVALVGGNGGTLTWRFSADSAPGRWLLHCHNEIHMVGGMMTEVVYS